MSTKSTVDRDNPKPLTARSCRCRLLEAKGSDAVPGKGGVVWLHHCEKTIDVLRQGRTGQRKAPDGPGQKFLILRTRFLDLEVRSSVADKCGLGLL